MLSLKYDSTFKMYILFISDVHFDSWGCDRGLLRELLDWAKENNVLVIENGDFCDMMGGKYDKRSSKKDIRPEYNNGNYFTEVIKDASGFLSNYPNIAIMNKGNHEYEVEKRHEFSTTESITALLPFNPIVFDYDGWIRLKFEHESGGRVITKDIFMTHGGGGGPVTGGITNTARRQENFRADFIVTGDIHKKYAFPRGYYYLDKAGQMQHRETKHIQLGTFKHKRTYYEKRKQYGVPGIGGTILKLFYRKGEILHETLDHIPC